MTKNQTVLLIAFFTWLMPLSQAQAAPGEYIFSAPPRGPAAKEREVYEPIARYLSRATGKKIVYRHPDNWLNYQNQMQKGQYDLVFDGPHFIGWRMSKVKHQPLAKLPGQLSFVVIARKDNNSILSINDLAGRTVCGLAPPNLATLTMYNQFPNPLRQPQVIEVKGFPVAFKGVISKRCDAAVMRDKMFFKLNAKSKAKPKVIWSSSGISNQGFSAGSRFSTADKQQITDALLAPEARKPLDKFFNRFSKKNKKMIPAAAGEYAGLGSLLRDVWGFEQ